MMKSLTLIITCFFLILPKVIFGCAMPPFDPPTVNDPPQPPPKVWMINHGIDPANGLNKMWFGVEVKPFDITNITTCTCGIGIGGATLPAVNSLNIIDAKLAITNVITHEQETVDAFDFSIDSTVTNDLENGMPDPQWQGFSANVNPTNLPAGWPNGILDPDEVLKLWFEIEIEPADILAFKEATTSKIVNFAVGSLDPAHPLEKFEGLKVPEPDIILLFISSLLMVVLSGIARRVSIRRQRYNEPDLKSNPVI